MFILRGEAVLKILPDDILRAEGTGVAVAEHISLQGEELLYGLKPCRRIAVEFCEQGCTDVLGKEDPFTLHIHEERDRTGRVAGRVDPAEVDRAEAKRPCLASKLSVNGKGFEIDIEAEGGGESYIPAFDDVRVIFVYDELRTEARAQKRRGTDVIGMAVGHDESLDIIGIEASLSNDIDHALKTVPRAAVYEHRFAAIKKINGTIPRIGHIRPGHAPQNFIDSLRSHNS